jgi:FKBP-type peptidyl-prolyl cis-trans isomerase
MPDPNNLFRRTNMTKLTEQSNIADIAAVYNELKGTNTDVKTLAKRGKAKLLAQIDALLEAQAEKKAEEQSAARAEEPKADEPPKTDGVNHFVQQMLQAADKKEEPAKPRAKREPKAPKEKKEKKGPVIRVVAEELLLEVVTHDEDKRPYGHSYEEILNRIRAQFEGAKTTAACLRWYAVHMRERGEKVPNRPRATPTATAKKEA